MRFTLPPKYTFELSKFADSCAIFKAVLTSIEILGHLLIIGTLCNYIHTYTTRVAWAFDSNEHEGSSNSVANDKSYYANIAEHESNKTPDVVLAFLGPCLLSPRIGPPWATFPLHLVTIRMFLFMHVRPDFCSCIGLRHTASIVFPTYILHRPLSNV